MANGNQFGTIGFCQIIGKKGYVYTGVIAGVATVATFVTVSAANIDPQNPQPVNMVIPVLAGLGAGAFTAFSTYITCKGVRSGIPYRRVRR